MLVPCAHCVSQYTAMACKPTAIDEHMPALIHPPSFVSRPGELPTGVENVSFAWERNSKVFVTEAEPVNPHTKAVFWKQYLRQVCTCSLCSNCAACTLTNFAERRVIFVLVWSFPPITYEHHDVSAAFLVINHSMLHVQWPVTHTYGDGAAVAAARSQSVWHCGTQNS